MWPAGANGERGSRGQRERMGSKKEGHVANERQWGARVTWPVRANGERGGGSCGQRVPLGSEEEGQRETVGKKVTW